MRNDKAHYKHGQRNGRRPQSKGKVMAIFPPMPQPCESQTYQFADRDGKECTAHLVVHKGNDGVIVRHVELYADGVSCHPIK